MTNDEQSNGQHVFDRTNGVVPPSEDGAVTPSTRADVLRQRQRSSALALGMFGMRHQ